MQRVQSWILVNILLFSFYFLFLWAGQLSAARAAQSPSWLNPYFFALYFCFFSRGILWIFILRRMDLTRAYVLTSLNYLIIPFLARLVLQEPLGLSRFLGGLLIAGGIILYGRGEAGRRTA